MSATYFSYTGIKMSCLRTGYCATVLDIESLTVTNGHSKSKVTYNNNTGTSLLTDLFDIGLYTTPLKSIA